MHKCRCLKILKLRSLVITCLCVFGCLASLSVQEVRMRAALHKRCCLTAVTQKGAGGGGKKAIRLV